MTTNNDDLDFKDIDQESGAHEGGALAIIDQRLTETIGFVKKILGDKLAPVALADQAALTSAQENISTIMDLEKAVVEYYRPIKEAARKPYLDVLEQEKSWLTAIGDVKAFVTDGVREYNNKIREEIRAREQAEADARAADERRKLAEQAVQAKIAGNDQAVEEIKAAAAEIIAAPVVEKKIMNRASVGTMSEKRVIADFRVVNQLNFINALIATGNGAIIVLDTKTETAFKKYLLSNEDVKEFPGVDFRRDYEVISRRK